MKTRMFVYLIIVLVLVAMLSGVACRGREELPAPAATQPPSGQPTSPAPAGKQPTPAGTRPSGGTGQNDLVASGASVTTLANPGEVRVVTGARNTGTGTISSSFTIRWYPHEASNVVGCSWDVAARDVTGRDAEVSCPYTYRERGEMHWRVVVDADNDVRETNENNNERTGTVRIDTAGGQVPPAPTNCTARSATAGAAAIEWQFSGNADGFRIYQGTTSLEKTVAANTRDTIIMGLRLNVQYHYDVRAYNAAGESRADACSADVTSR